MQDPQARPPRRPRRAGHPPGPCGPAAWRSPQLFDNGVAVDARKVNSQRRDLRVRVEAATLEERQGPAIERSRLSRLALASADDTERAKRGSEFEVVASQ